MHANPTTLPPANALTVIAELGVWLGDPESSVTVATTTATLVSLEVGKAPPAPVSVMVPIGVAGAEVCVPSVLLTWDVEVGVDEEEEEEAG